MARDLCTDGDFFAQAFPDLEQDWPALMTLIVNTFFECVKITSNLSELPTSREQIDLAKVPWVIQRIQETTGIVLHLRDLSDDASVEADHPIRNPDCADNLMMAHIHIPLRHWLFVSKPLKMELRFERLWTIEPPAEAMCAPTAAARPKG